MEISFLILLVLGLAAGIVAGLFGLGGGVLFTPILFVVFSNAGVDNPVVLTIGSSLFCTFIASIGSSIRQFRQNNFYWVEGLKVGLFGVMGVSAGKQVVTSSYYNQKVFVIFFCLLLIYVAYLFFRRGRSKKGPFFTSMSPVTLSQSLMIGGIGGFVAALAGIGGGGVMVPALNLYFGKKFKKAVSISSLAIVFISLAGWLQLAFWGTGAEGITTYSLGNVDFGTAMPLAVGGLIGGFLGALINLKIKRQYLQYAFAVLAMGMALKLLTEAF